MLFVNYYHIFVFYNVYRYFKIGQMNKKYLLSITLAAAFTSSSAFGQNELTTGYKQYELGLYDASMVTLARLEQSGVYDAKSLATLGDVCVKLGKYNTALTYFQKARDISPTDNFFSYGFAKALINTAQYEKAKAELSYLKLDDSVNHLMDYCDKALAINGNSTRNAVITNNGNNYGLTLVNNLLVFNTSLTPVMSDLAKKAVANQKGAYLVKYNNGKISLVNDDFTHRLNIGTISVANNGKCIYTVTNPLCDSPACRNRNASLHEGYIINGQLVEGKSLSINAFGSSNFDPALAADGKTLYFSSDRPGGLGGADIYVSNFNNGTWSQPVNLGAPTNTKGNEVSPCVDGTDLLFASDYHFGLGGYDIFKIDRTSNTGVEKVEGVNSSADETYPFSVDGKLYFTSNYTENNNEAIFSSPYTGKNKQIALVTPQAYDLSAAVSDVASKSGNDNVLNARLVSTGYTVTNATKGTYYIQLAAFGSSKSDFSKFASLTKMGNVYKVYVGQAVKVRLGFYYTEAEARDMLVQVKKNGYPDAFIVQDEVANSNVELIHSSGKVSTPAPSQPNTNTYTKPAATSSVSYKVRLASYEDPIWFDNAKVKDIGTIEQWSKGTWTIFVLGGFKTLEDAELARIKSVNRGFANAEVVVDTGGILEPLKKN